MNLRAVLAMAGLIALTSNASGADDRLPCPLACAEFNPRDSVVTGATRQLTAADLAERRARLLEAQTATNNDNRGYWWASHGLSLAGAAIEGAAPDQPLYGAAVGVGTELISKSSDWAMDEYVGRRVDHMAAALDKELGGVLLRDGEISEQEFRRYEAQIKGLLFDPEFQKQFDGDLQGVIKEAREGASFNLLARTFENGRKIQGTVAELKEKADEASVRVQEIKQKVETAYRRLNAAINRSATESRDREQAIKRSVSLNTEILASQLPPRLRLAFADRTGMDLESSERERLERVVKVQDIRTFQSDVKEVSGALLRSGLLDENTAEFVAEATALTDATLNLAAAFTDPTGIGMAVGVMNMVGTVRGLGKKPGPSAEARMLMKVLEELRELRKELREMHAEQMEALHRLQASIDLLHQEIRVRLTEINDRLIFVQLATQELLLQPVAQCQKFEAIDRSPPFVAPAKRSLREFAKFWEANRLTASHRQCIEGAEALFGRWWADGVISQAFVAVVANAGAGGASESARAGRAFADSVFVPSVTYTKTHVPSPSAIEVQRLFMPSARWAPDEAVQDVGTAMVNWQPPTPQLSQSKLYAPFGQDYLAPEVVARVSRGVRGAARVSGFLWERNGSTRLISDEDIESEHSIPPDGRIEPLLQRLETHVRAALAQEHMIAGTLVVDRAATVLDETLIPAYAAARYSGDYKQILAMISPAGSPNPAQASTCGTGALPYDTLCLMQKNPQFAENVTRVLTWKRLTKNGGSVEALRRAMMAADGSRLRQLLGHDIQLSDSSEPAAFPEVAKAYGQNTPPPAWALELPRIFFNAPLTSNPPELPAEFTGPRGCWADPPNDLDLASANNAPRAERARREWTRCYALTPANVLARRELRVRPAFQQLRAELEGLRVAFFYQTDPHAPPQGLRELVATAAWAASADEDARRMRESALPSSSATAR